MEGEPRAEAIRRVSELEAEIQELQQALTSRGHIEQVVGMFMLVLGCDETTAWKSLVYVSSNTNRKVRDLTELVAAHVGCGQVLPDDVAGLLADVLGHGQLRFRRP